MNILGWVILITAVSGVLGTGIGGIIGGTLRRESDKAVSLLLGFAGGVMLAIVCFELIPESFHPEGAENDMSLMLVVAGILSGFFIIYVLNLIIDKRTNPEVQHIDSLHPKTADNLNELIHSDHYEMHKTNSNDKKRELFIAGIVMASAIALHNLPEGMIIGASYAADSGSITEGAGFIVALVIGLHNIPEGMSVSAPLVSGSVKPWKAALIAALSGVPTIIGAVIGYSLGMVSPIWLSLSLSFAGGAMLYVVFGELLPESFLMWKSKAPGIFALIGILVGVVLVYMGNS